MRAQILKAMKYHQLIDVIYIAKNGAITKRRVKVLTVAGGSMQVYCHTKKAKRTFILDQILAVKSVNLKERGIG